MKERKKGEKKKAQGDKMEQVGESIREMQEETGSGRIERKRKNTARI